MATYDFTPVINGIQEVIEREEPILQSLSDDVISTRFNSQNRSIKQLLGHLIDSASNNHQRIIRLQYDNPLVFPDYTQDNDRWIAIQDYQHTEWNNIIQLWKFYNLHIIQLIRSVDHSKLNNYWTDYEGNKTTLREMIEGYLWHLNLHIRDIHDLLV